MFYVDAALRLKTASKNNNAKKCMLCLDGMSLKANVFYDVKSDSAGDFCACGDGKRNISRLETIDILFC